MPQVCDVCRGPLSENAICPNCGPRPQTLHGSPAVSLWTAQSGSLTSIKTWIEWHRWGVTATIVVAVVGALAGGWIGTVIGLVLGLLVSLFLPASTRREEIRGG
jgi:hypothetical protein